jgi:transcriptional regulator with XRE-family HTH domain
MGFRENLKSELEYSGMLVKELAAHSGIKKKTIESYLRINGYTPSVTAAVSIAKALGVSVEYLVSGTDSAKDRPLTSLNSEIQEIVSASEHLNSRDRQVVLNLAKFMKKR